MPSKEQIAANRRNAQHSTGPRTPEGKARTAQNARTHGLMSGELLTPFEQQEELLSHAKAIREHFDPLSEIESILVEQIVSATWRLRRVRRIETRHYRHRDSDLRENRERSGDRFDDETQVYRDDWNGPKFIDTLGRHEARLERSFYRALHQLEHIQSHRPDAGPEDLPNQPNSPQPIETVIVTPPTTPPTTRLVTDIAPGVRPRTPPSTSPAKLAPHGLPLSGPIGVHCLT